MYKKIRPLLFRLKPEAAHEVGRFILKKNLVTDKFITSTKLKTKINGIGFPNPVGLAAGFDKNCEMLPSLQKLGFGFLTLGSITRSQRKGNEKPWMVRKPIDEAIVNAMGLPSNGIQKCVENLRYFNSKVPLIASLASFETNDLPEMEKIISPHVDIVEINISSPTFKGTLEHPDIISNILKSLPEDKKYFIKLPPYKESKERDAILRIVEICKGHTLVLTNTKKVQERGISVGYGGLSGKPLFYDTLRIVRDIYSYKTKDTSIIACGGVFNGQNAFDLLSAGADGVELLTSLIYEGPYVANAINSQLLDIMDQKKIENITELKS